jgi:hypothetical protein
MSGHKIKEGNHNELWKAAESCLEHHLGQKFLILLGEGDFDVRPLEDLNFRPYEGHIEQALRQEKGSNLL